MMIRVLLYFLFFLLTFHHQAIASDIKVSHTKLKNGLEVYVIPINLSPIVIHSLWYKVGGLNDPVGSSGAAHYLEHLMFNGTKNFESFFEEMNRIGAIHNAYTTFSHTVYYDIFPKNKLAHVMSIEADRMSNLKISSNQAMKEKSVVLEERKLRVDSNPQEVLYEEMDRIFYNHNYRPLIGWKKDIDDIDEKVLKKLYKRYYTPDNAILIIAGDVNADEVIKLAEAKYINKKSKYSSIATISNPIVPSLKFPTTITHTDLIKEANMVIWYKVPTEFTEKENLATNLALWNLSKRKNSLLNKALLNKNLASSVSSYYDRDGHVIVINITPKHSAKLEDVESELDNVMNSFIIDGINEEEMQDAKHYYRTSTLYSLDDNMFNLVSFYGSSLMKGIELKDIDPLSNKLNLITLNDINSVIKSIFSSKARLIGKLLPKHEVKNETIH